MRRSGMRLAALLATVALASATGALAQNAPPSQAAAPADVASPEAIVQAVYATISGPAGQARDWPRLRSLMLPEGRFVATHVLNDGSVRTRLLSVEQYISGADKAFATMGFFEHGVIAHIDRLPHVATVVSPYVSRKSPGEKPFARGVNQFQLVNDGKRWWIVDIIWEDEGPLNPLPPDAAELLKAER